MRRPEHGPLARAASVHMHGVATPSRRHNTLAPSHLAPGCPVRGRQPGTCVWYRGQAAKVQVSWAPGRAVGMLPCLLEPGAWRRAGVGFPVTPANLGAFPGSQSRLHAGVLQRERAAARGAAWAGAAGVVQGQAHPDHGQLGEDVGLAPALETVRRCLDWGRSRGATAGSCGCTGRATPACVVAGAAAWWRPRVHCSGRRGARGECRRSAHAPHTPSLPLQVDTGAHGAQPHALTPCSAAPRPPAPCGHPHLPRPRDGAGIPRCAAAAHGIVRLSRDAPIGVSLPCSLHTFSVSFSLILVPLDTLSTTEPLYIQARQHAWGSPPRLASAGGIACRGLPVEWQR